MKSRFFAAIFVALSMLAACPCASAVTWESATVMETIPDGEVKLGRFTLLLPDGKWLVAAKGKDQSTGWSNQAAPVFLSLAVARVETGKVIAVLSLYTLANSTYALWNDSACQIPDVIKDDRTGSNFRYPECLVVAKSPHQQWWSAQPTSYFGRVGKAIISYPAEISNEGLQIRYLRSYRQDHLRVDAYLPTFTADTGSPALAWAALLRTAIKAHVEGDAAQAAIPSIPVLAQHH